jgi:signal peptidase I
MKKDQFFPLGDNSPASQDARSWGQPDYVARELLIGKALLIYWPHAWNRPVYFTPNFQRMGVIK